MTGRRGSLCDRFWAKVDKSGPVVRPGLGPCWVWKAGTAKDGYGRVNSGVRSGGRLVIDRAHRVAWQLLVAPVPDAGCVLHRCDNRLCVKAVADGEGPAHLFLGTRAENMHDMHDKGRNRQPSGPAHHWARLTDQDVDCIRKLHATGAFTYGELAKAFRLHKGYVGQLVRAEYRA